MQISCPACRRVLSVPDEAAGRVGTCPHCQQRLRVPSTTGRSTTLAAPYVATQPTTLDSPAASDSCSVNHHSERLRVGVTTILFGWTGYHYFYWRSWIRGTIILVLSFFSLLAGGSGLLLTISFGIYDGIRYLTMTDDEFAAIIARKRPPNTIP